MVGVWDESLWSRRPCTCVREIFLCSLSLHQAVSRSQLFHFSQILFMPPMSPLSWCIHEYMRVCVCYHVLLALFSFRWKILIKTYITNTCTYWGCRDEVILRCRDSCQISVHSRAIMCLFFNLRGQQWPSWLTWCPRRYNTWTKRLFTNVLVYCESVRFAKLVLQF